MIGLIIILLCILLGLRLYFKRKKRIRNFQMPADTQQILLGNVAFYKKLTDDQKKEFESRIRDFLQHVTITGIGTTVEPIDQILIASGAIIPIFGFPGWKYKNISEILLYKDAFNEEYEIEGTDRNILGMVGDGPLQRQMILSQLSVRASFQLPSDGRNTVIHEFIHLVDKADGAVDGVPEYFLSRPDIIPWQKRMHEVMEEMQRNEHPDINFYGTKNDAEFFAVISEYFFELPEELKINHPELYQLLEQMFRPV